MSALLESAPLSSAAVSRGQTFQGVPCKKFGHTLRYTRGGKCVECLRTAARKRLQES